MFDRQPARSQKMESKTQNVIVIILFILITGLWAAVGYALYKVEENEDDINDLQKQRDGDFLSLTTSIATKASNDDHEALDNDVSAILQSLLSCNTDHNEAPMPVPAPAPGPDYTPGVDGRHAGCEAKTMALDKPLIFCLVMADPVGMCVECLSNADCGASTKCEDYFCVTA